MESPTNKNRLRFFRIRNLTLVDAEMFLCSCNSSKVSHFKCANWSIGFRVIVVTNFRFFIGFTITLETKNRCLESIGIFVRQCYDADMVSCVFHGNLSSDSRVIVATNFVRWILHFFYNNSQTHRPTLHVSASIGNSISRR